MSFISIFNKEQIEYGSIQTVFRKASG